MTTKLLREYKEMIDHTTSDLQEILLSTTNHGSVESFLHGDSAVQSEANGQLDIEEERASLEKCLNICRDVSKHIENVQAGILADIATPADSGGMSVKLDKASQARLMTRERLDDCKTEIGYTCSELRTRLQDANYRLTRLSRLSKHEQGSNDDETRNQSVTEEFDGIVESLTICADATEKIAKERINVFEDVNMADDGHLVIVSTFGDLISAKRVVTGARATNWLGQMTDASLQQLSKDHARTDAKENLVASIENKPNKEDGQAQDVIDPHFVARHGTGRKLS